MNRWIAAPALLGALSLGVAACGSSGGSKAGSTGSSGGSSSSGSSGSNGEANKSVSQIGKDVQSAMAGLKSFHMAGSINSNGETIKLDMNLESSGPGGGTMTLNGSTFQMVVNGQALYFMGDANFWQQVGKLTASQASQVAGKWVTGIPSSSDLSSLAGLTNVSSFVNDLNSGSSGNSGGASKGSVATFNGHSALSIKSKDGTAYVAATGPAYLLGLQGANNGGTLTFDQFNTANPPSVPSGAINLGSLSGSGNS